MPSTKKAATPRRTRTRKGNSPSQELATPRRRRTRKGATPTMEVPNSQGNKSTERIEPPGSRSRSAGRAEGNGEKTPVRSSRSRRRGISSRLKGNVKTPKQLEAVQSELKRLDQRLDQVALEQTKSLNDLMEKMNLLLAGREVSTSAGINPDETGRTNTRNVPESTGITNDTGTKRSPESTGPTNDKNTIQSMARPSISEESDIGQASLSNRNEGSIEGISEHSTAQQFITAKAPEVPKLKDLSEQSWITLDRTWVLYLQECSRRNVKPRSIVESITGDNLESLRCKLNIAFDDPRPITEREVRRAIDRAKRCREEASSICIHTLPEALTGVCDEGLQAEWRINEIKKAVQKHLNDYGLDHIWNSTDNKTKQARRQILKSIQPIIRPETVRAHFSLYLKNTYVASIPEAMAKLEEIAEKEDAYQRKAGVAKKFLMKEQRPKSVSYQKAHKAEGQPNHSVPSKGKLVRVPKAFCVGCQIQGHYFLRHVPSHPGTYEKNCPEVYSKEDEARLRRISLDEIQKRKTQRAHKEPPKRQNVKAHLAQQFRDAFQAFAADMQTDIQANKVLEDVQDPPLEEPLGPGSHEPEPTEDLSPPTILRDIDQDTMLLTKSSTPPEYSSDDE